MEKVVTLTVRKARVFDEVMKTTEYMGKKLVGEQDKGAYVRVAATDADGLMLERFWLEGCGLAAQALRRYAVGECRLSGKGGVPDMAKDYEVTLRLPGGFDAATAPDLERSLFSYIVTTMLSKWCLLANRTDAQAYMELSNVSLQDINRKLFNRKRPERP